MDVRIFSLSTLSLLKSRDMLLLFKRKPVTMFDFQRVSYTLFCDASTTLQLKKPRIVKNKEKVIGMRSLEERMRSRSGMLILRVLYTPPDSP